jgi:hypothetical protein
MSDFPKQHLGEMHSLALSLHLNAKLKKPIVLLIDDFPAIQAFAKTIDDQKFAIQMSVPDVIINFFKTEPALDENETAASLQTYFNIMTKAIHYKTFKMRVEQSCRNILFKKCGVKCLL